MALRSRRRRTHSVESSALRRRLAIEHLEDRRLLAITVDTVLDVVDLNDGVTSLREAIFAANVANGADTIEFAAELTTGGPATILLTQGEIAITDALTIDGPAVSLLTIDAQLQSRIFNIDDPALEDENFDVHISGLTLVRGRTTGDGGLVGGTSQSGGAIRFDSQGALSLDRAELRGNSTLGRFASGGAVFARGDVLVTLSTIVDNSTSGMEGRGGGIHGLSNVEIVVSQVRGNQSSGTGAVGGGVSGRLDVVVRQSSVFENATHGPNGHGGGVAGGQVTVIDSTVARNQAFGAQSLGGGIHGSVVEVHQSTVSENSTAGIFGMGGGIMASQGTLIANSTIAGNVALHSNAQGGGLMSFGDVAVVDSVIANNLDGEGDSDIGMSAQANLTVSYSLIRSMSGLSASQLAAIDAGSGNKFNQDPLLRPLANNGGPLFLDGSGMLTHALFVLSPVIDAGDPAAVAGGGGVPEFDQRGFSLLRVTDGDGAGGARIDMGAYERQPGEAYTLVVDTVADENDGDYSAGDFSLREAVAVANLVPGINTIEFAAELTAEGSATILLTQGEIVISEALTVEGPGANLLTIDAQQQSRIFDITATMGDFRIDELTLTRGSTPVTSTNPVSGGAIRSSTVGAIALDHVKLLDNDARFRGGAIYARGALMLTDSEFRGNHSGNSGGAVFSEGMLNARNSTFQDNWTLGSNATGGSIHAVGKISISESTFLGNRTEGTTTYGGAVYGGDDVFVERTEFSLNSTGTSAFEAGSALYAVGRIDLVTSDIHQNSVGQSRGYTVLGRDAVYITDSHIYGNNGGGVHAFEDIAVLRSVIESNKVSSPQWGGGGVSSRGDATIADSTISYNEAIGEEGGGVYASRVVVTGSTIFGNSVSGPQGRGGGISAGTGGIVTLVDSTVAENHAQGDGGGVFAFRVDATQSSIVGNYTNAPFSPGGGVWAKRVNFDHVVVESNYTMRENSPGGGVYAESVTISNSIFNSNWTTLRDSAGGALRVVTPGGSLVSSISHSRFIGNKTSGNTSPGGAIAFYLGSLSIDGCVIAGNSTAGRFSAGGGIQVGDGTLTIASSVITGNHTTGDISRGGGIDAYHVHQILVTKSIISKNYTAGSESSGGGLVADGTVSDSAISNNYTLGNQSIGGGVYSPDVLILRASTVSGNWTAGADSHGAGIASDEFFSYQSTIVQNHADHIASIAGGVWSQTNFNNRFLIVGSIVAKNQAPAGNPDLRSNLFLNYPPYYPHTKHVSYSVIGSNGGTGLIEAPIGSPDQDKNLIGGPMHGVIDPKLGPLTYNGGPIFVDGSGMLTHALLPGSPAINAGDPAALAGMDGVPEFDQRGEPWSRVVGGRIDMGAVEAQANPLPGDYSFNGVVDAADYVVWRNTVGSPDDLRADGSGPTFGVPDGVVDDFDRVFWKSNFGNVFEQGAGSKVQGVEAVAGAASASATDKEPSRRPSETDDLVGWLAAGSQTMNQVERRQSVYGEGVAREVHGSALLAWISGRNHYAVGRDEVDGDEHANESAESDSNTATVDDVFELIGSAEVLLD